MIINVILLLVGLVLILSGANFLTDGAAALAKRFNISSLVIGLTIVAFGTSAPELTVSVVSAINGSAELAIGNVVGSNIFNIPSPNLRKRELFRNNSFLFIMFVFKLNI